MNVNNNANTINFKGYDARKLKAVVMNTNYAGIADEVKKIGDIENFEVLLLQNKGGRHILKRDEFERSAEFKGAWAQDYWGITKNTLLARDNLCDQTFQWRILFGLKPNQTQLKVQKESGLERISEYMDFLYNLPIINKQGKDYVQIATNDGIEEIDKAIYDVEFNINQDLLKNLSNKCHIKGGNYFLTKNANGNDDLLIGKEELKKFSIPELKEMFEAENVHIIPQADYHLDLFIRPLNDKKVLIADDETMYNTIAEGFKRVQEFIISKPTVERIKYKELFVNMGTYLRAFRRIIQQNPYTNMQDVEKALIESGYEPIKVPARLFEIQKTEANETSQSFILNQLHNYVNAFVHINDNNELIYVTNKSNLDETLGLTPKLQEELGFSFEKEFLNAIKPHVDRVYFVSGEDNKIAKEILPEYFGGIHCLTMEVPR